MYTHKKQTCAFCFAFHTSKAFNSIFNFLSSETVNIFYRNYFSFQLKHLTIETVETIIIFHSNFSNFSSTLFIHLTIAKTFISQIFQSQTLAIPQFSKFHVLFNLFNNFNSHLLSAKEGPKFYTTSFHDVYSPNEAH